MKTIEYMLTVSRSRRRLWARLTSISCGICSPRARKTANCEACVPRRNLQVELGDPEHLLTIINRKVLPGRAPPRSIRVLFAARRTVPEQGELSASKIASCSRPESIRAGRAFRGIDVPACRPKSIARQPSPARRALHLTDLLKANRYLTLRSLPSEGYMAKSRTISKPSSRRGFSRVPATRQDAGARTASSSAIANSSSFTRCCACALAPDGRHRQPRRSEAAGVSGETNQEMDLLRKSTQLLGA